MKKDDEFVSVRMSDLKTWREHWLEQNDPEEFGTDIVTPFDSYLYGWPKRPPKPPYAPKTSVTTGGPVDYYRVFIAHPNQAEAPYTAECGDIIEALGLDFNQGCAFKALWRAGAAVTLDKAKPGYAGTLYDAEKADFYTKRNLIITKSRTK